MPRFIGAAALAAGLAAVLTGCRDYQYYDKVSDGDALVPADQYARYGREEAEKIAIGRALGDAHQGDDPAAYARQVEVASRYARTLPDVQGVTSDALGHWLLVQFKSGWRVSVLPISDGKRPQDTPNLPPASPAGR